MYQFYERKFKWPSIIMVSYCVVIITILISFKSISTKSIQSSTTPVIDGKWQPLLNISDDTIRQLFMPRLLNLTEIANEWMNVSKNCRHDIRESLAEMFEPSRNRQTWAFKMFDSWSKVPSSGMFRGTITDYGDYDQCLSIDKSTIPTQYCLVDFAMPMPKPQPKHHNFFHKTIGLLPENFQHHNGSTIYEHLEKYSSIFYYTNIEMAICMPNTCNQNDLETILKDAEKIGLELKKLSCEHRPTERWRPNLPQFIAILMLITVFVLSIVAFINDCIHDGKDRNEFITCFSPARNCRKLFTTKTSSSGNDELSCIHGLRVLTICWIIMGHTLDWNNLNVFRDTFLIKESLSDLTKQPFFRTHFSVETFFYITGLLTSYITLGYTKGKLENFNSIAFIVLRYLRLTPQLVAFMLLTSLLPIMFDGPLWTMYNDRMIGQCHRTWWHNLIYMQNIIDNENICAIHTWFLAADMQLHWLALFPIIAMLKNPRIGLIFAKFLVIFFTLISSLIIYIGQLPPGYVVTTKSDFLDEQGKPSELVQFFHKPWNHCNVFFIGFIFGAYLHKNLSEISCKLQMNKGKKIALWMLALFGYLSCIYSNSFYLFGREYEPFFSALIFASNRLIWALVLTLVIWLCITGNGMWIGRLLSWSAVRPLSRMTFSVYLVHAWTFTVLIGTKRDLIDIRPTAIIFLFASMISISYVLAFIFTLLFESPFIHMMDFAKKSMLMPASNKMKTVPTITKQMTDNNDKIHYEQQNSKQQQQQHSSLLTSVESTNI
uniref:Nose resistant to fluoxetine protein 6-like isoform X1 n=1 Tax=Dermatophagoides pteronyssinus TaxID=6956 RepID=A0A6P6YLS4_DERPT|nr:nose resistant to fluoxetine protein 6-like isoform X1 [Dermatophagoides pteronyssinus]